MNPQKFDVFGTSVSCISDKDLARCIEHWAASQSDIGHVVCFSDTHGLVKAHDDPSMGQALRTADIVAPDGHPIAWVGRLLYGLSARRLCGPDFLEFLASRSADSGLRHYLFGGKPGVADELAATLQQRHPGIKIVGTDSPPMGISSPQEIEQQLACIIAAKPEVVWIGLGAPKQEIWMAQHRHRLAGMTLCGVGAAFDFHTGRVRRAPAWMQRCGLEWAHRCCSEPRRLAPRYAKTICRFVVLFARQSWRMALSGKLRPDTPQTSPRT